MGFFSKISREPPPTATDFVHPDEGSPSADLEKKAETLEDTAHLSNRHVVPDIERRVIRKMDARIVPLVTALYVLAFLDRSNIGNARIAGMSKELHLGEVKNHYQWLLTIFYITYILFEWQALMWKIVPPHRWLAFTVLGWGLVATAQAGTHSWSGMMACRFFLGISEAGFGPGIPYLLSFFYLRHEVGVRIAVFLSAAPLSTTFSGALAYGITSGHSKLANWRLLFLVEGLPTICMVPVAYLFLPDTPDQARFLTAEEKLVAKARGVRQVGATERIGGIAWREAGAALLDAKCWFTAFMYFSVGTSISRIKLTKERYST